jgi:hypothetical protein
MTTPETETEQAEPYRPFEELRDAGLLWLINRVVFHPRGLALAIMLDDDGVATGWKLLGDGSEVWTFNGPADDEEFAKATAYLATITSRAEQA